MLTAGGVVLSMAAALLYGTGAVCAWRELRRGLPGGPLTWELALVGMAAQAGALLWGWVSEGQVAFVGGAGGSLGVFAVCVGMGFLLLRARSRGPVWGVLLLPVASVAALAGALWGALHEGGVASTFGMSWGLLHVIPAVAGIACLVAAAALCLTYLVEERYLRARQLRDVLQWLPALEVLDHLSAQALRLAFALLSLGLAAGAVRALLWKELGGAWVLDPKVVSAAATWLLVGGVAVARRRGQFGGRRFAYLVLLAAALAAFTYVGVDALLRGGHAGL